MKPFLFVAFVRWIFSKMFSKILELNESFRRTLRYEPGFAIFFWMIGSMVVMTVVSMIGAGFIDTAEQFGWFVLTQISIAVFYLAVNGITIMYEAFKRDREELFNILKDSK